MGEWIPLLQTLVWPIFVIALIYYFRGTCCAILDAIADRIKRGSSVKAGPGGFELGSISKDIEKLPDAPQPASPAETLPEPHDWQQERSKEYARVDGYMLVHVYRPSASRSGWYDIFLFLVRHRKGAAGPPSRQLDEIEKAEFFFGESWGNRTFSIKNTGSIIGVRTRAYGTFLAVCRVTFNDEKRKPVVVYRYVDFQMLLEHPDEC